MSDFIANLKELAVSWGSTRTGSRIVSSLFLE